MPVAATIGAVGSLGAAGIGAFGASSAAKTAAKTEGNALDLQKSMFNTAQQNLSPFVNAGTGTLDTLKSLITPGANMTDVLSKIPGFTFASDWGTRSATNALAARGLGGSVGPVARGVSDYNQGLAGNMWQSVVNALQGFTNTGEAAAAGVGTAAVQTGANAGNTLGQIAGIQQSGILGTTNALAGGISGGTNALTNAMLLSRLSGSGIYAPQPEQV